MYSKNNEGRLIKGVIYDDVDMEGVKEDMFSYINDTYHISDEKLIQFANEAYIGWDVNTIREYLGIQDAISSLTRYNFDTGVTHNLIIPKECLSRGLAQELEKVDLAKSLRDDYNNKFINDYLQLNNSIDDTEPCDEPYDCIKKSCRFCNDCEGEQTLQKNNGTYYFNGKKVSREEFMEKASQSPKTIELLEGLTDMLSRGFLF